jgi:hypothetical protein
MKGFHVHRLLFQQHCYQVLFRHHHHHLVADNNPVRRDCYQREPVLDLLDRLDSNREYHHHLFLPQLVEGGTVVVVVDVVRMGYDILRGRTPSGEGAYQQRTHEVLVRDHLVVAVAVVDGLDLHHHVHPCLAADDNPFVTSVADPVAAAVDVVAVAFLQQWEQLVATNGVVLQKPFFSKVRNFLLSLIYRKYP